MKKFINWVKGIYSKTQRLINKFIPISVKVVQALKNCIEDGTLDNIANFIKVLTNELGDAAISSVVEYLKTNVPKYCVDLNIIEAVRLSGDNEEDIRTSLVALSEVFGDDWSTFMSGMSGKLTEFFSDGVISWEEAKELGSEYYDEYVKGK